MYSNNMGIPPIKLSQANSAKDLKQSLNYKTLAKTGNKFRYSRVSNLPPMNTINFASKKVAISARNY